MTQMFSTKFGSLLAVITVATLTSACSGINSDTADLVGGQNLNESLDLSKLETELEGVETQMQSLTDKMNGLSILSLGSQLDGGKKLAEQFRAIIDQLLSGVRKVKIQAESLKQQFADRLSQLDPNNPDHIELIMRLEKALAYLDEVEGYIGKATSKMLESIDQVIAKVDGLVAGISSGSPLSFVVGLVWQTVKTEIISFRDSLVI